MPFDMPSDADRVDRAGAGVVVGGQQHPPVRRVGGVERGQVHAAVEALENREGERAPWQRLQVGIGQQPRHQPLVEAEFGQGAVGAPELVHRVENRFKRLVDRGLIEPRAPSRPAHPGGEHVRHRLLVRHRQHHLARQPAEQERPHLHRRDPVWPAEILVAAVIDDPVGAVAGRAPVRQVLGLVRGEELRGQQRPPLT